MIDISKVADILYDRGWYTICNRLNDPEFRAEKFKGEWTDDLLKEYLILHIGEEETQEILNSI